MLLLLLFIIIVVIIIVIIIIILFIVIIIIYYYCYYCYYYYIYIYIYICGFSITVQPGCFFKNGGNSPAHKAITKQLLVIRWEIPMEVAAPSHDHDAMTMPVLRWAMELVNLVN